MYGTEIVVAAAVSLTSAKINRFRQGILYDAFPEISEHECIAFAPTRITNKPPSSPMLRNIFRRAIPNAFPPVNKIALVSSEINGNDHGEGNWVG